MGQYSQFWMKLGPFDISCIDCAAELQLQGCRLTREVRGSGSESYINTKIGSAGLRHVLKGIH
jgi:hypothetical protein